MNAYEIKLNQASGPMICHVCGAWPASMTHRGPMCNHCDDIEHAAAHPVPLPDNPNMLIDLARIGVVGATEKLYKIQNQ